MLRAAQNKSMAGQFGSSRKASPLFAPSLQLPSYFQVLLKSYSPLFCGENLGPPWEVFLTFLPLHAEELGGSAVGRCPSSAPPHPSTDPCVSAPSTAQQPSMDAWLLLMAWMLLMASRKSCFSTVSSPVMSCSLRGAMSLT